MDLFQLSVCVVDAQEVHWTGYGSGRRNPKAQNPKLQVPRRCSPARSENLGLNPWSFSGAWSLGFGTSHPVLGYLMHLSQGSVMCQLSAGSDFTGGLLRRRLGLNAVKLGINAVARNQFIVCAFLSDRASLKHDNFVSISDST